MKNKLDVLRPDFLEIAKGVFPGIRDDVAILISNPRYMTKREKEWLRHYQVIDRGLVYEFDAYLVTCLDDSQMLCIAKYDSRGGEFSYAVSEIGRGEVELGMLITEDYL